MGRAERRRAEQLERREASQYAAYITKRDAAKNAAIAKLSKNGITPEDLEKEFEKGYTRGFREAAEPVIRSCFAAVCLALNDLHKFGSRRCADVLRAVDQHMERTLTSEEIIDEVWERMGLKLDFKDPFDRIQEL